MPDRAGGLRGGGRHRETGRYLEARCVSLGDSPCCGTVSVVMNRAFYFDWRGFSAIMAQ